MQHKYLYENALGDITLDVGNVTGGTSITDSSMANMIHDGSTGSTSSDGSSIWNSILNTVSSVTGSIAKIISPEAGTLTSAQQAALLQNRSLTTSGYVSQYIPWLIFGGVGLTAILLLTRKK